MLPEEEFLDEPPLDHYEAWSVHCGQDANVLPLEFTDDEIASYEPRSRLDGRASSFGCSEGTIGWLNVSSV